jgi:hypothetical protein
VLIRDAIDSDALKLNVGARVCWRDDKNDQGTVTETNCAIGGIKCVNSDYAPKDRV